MPPEVMKCKWSTMHTMQNELAQRYGKAIVACRVEVGVCAVDNKNLPILLLNLFFLMRASSRSLRPKRFAYNLELLVVLTHEDTFLCFWTLENFSRTFLTFEHPLFTLESFCSLTLKDPFLLLLDTQPSLSLIGDTRGCLSSLLDTRGFLPKPLASRTPLSLLADP